MLVLTVGSFSMRNGAKPSKKGARASFSEHRFCVTLGGIQVSLHIQDQKLFIKASRLLIHLIIFNTRLLIFK